MKNTGKAYVCGTMDHPDKPGGDGNDMIQPDQKML